jgi:signal transduction histidine kinase
MWRRGSLRVRLTVAFGAMFFAATAAVLAVTVILVQNSMEYSLNIALSYAPDDGTKAIIMGSMWRNLLFKGGVAALVVGVVATTIGWLVSGRVLRPLRQITATAQRIAGRTLHRRIALEMPAGEVKSLADSFDSMLDRLDHAFAGQSRFISNAAHELKTPLVLNRTLVEVAMMRPGCPPEVHQLGENLLAVNARHERLIDSLLTLARAEDAMSERVIVDLADLGAAATARIAAFAGTRGVAVHSELASAPTIGDAILLEQMINNLVDNAIRYNAPDGWVRVSTAPRGSAVEVVVSNAGAHISPHEVPVLFEPFRRLTDRVGSAGGNGLGLSIVRAVVRAHGGAVSAHPRPEGGLTVRVTLPPAAGLTTVPVPMTEMQGHPTNAL